MSGDKSLVPGRKPLTGPGRVPGASLYTRKFLSHTGQGESLVPPYTRGSFSLTRARARAWCLLIHAEVSLSHGGQGERLMPPYTRGRFSLTRARARAWCLLIHAVGSVLLTRGQGAAPAHGPQGRAIRAHIPQNCVKTVRSAGFDHHLAAERRRCAREVPRGHYETRGSVSLSKSKGESRHGPCRRAGGGGRPRRW